MTYAGIDTTIFTAHSTSHASTSAATWTSSSATFARFYDLPLCSEQNFAQSILNNSNVNNT